MNLIKFFQKYPLNEYTKKEREAVGSEINAGNRSIGNRFGLKNKRIKPISWTTTYKPA